MPLGLPRRSYDNGSSTLPRTPVATSDSGDHGVDGKLASDVAHRRSSSFNDAVLRPRILFSFSGPLFKGLATFHNDHRRHSPPTLLVDTYTDNGLDFDSTSRQEEHDNTSKGPVVVSPQVQPQHYQPSRLLSLFAQPTTIVTPVKSSLPFKSPSSPNSSKESSHFHSKSEAAITIKDTSNGNMASVASASPSKPSSARTYDAKLVTREMHRLGTLAGLGPLAPSLSSGPSASTLALPSASSSATLVPSVSHNHGGGLSGAIASDKDNPWSTLHVHVLPLFNEEALRVPIEDLNALVRRHIQTVLAVSPSKALATLSADARELIGAGMVTLNAKLAAVADELLVSRLVEQWLFFWDYALAYVEGVLLPLRTDPLLTSLHRTPKQHRPSSPTRQGTKLASGIHNSLPTIDVRSVALCAFRDRVVVPLYCRLHTLLSPPLSRETVTRLSQYQLLRLQQMLLVLTSERRTRPPSPTLSLRAPTAQPNAGETAISDLLCLFSKTRLNTHNPWLQRRTITQSTARSATPSFLSARIPRDRRGRIGGTHNMGSAILNAGGLTNDSAVGPQGRSEELEVLDADAEEMDNGDVETPRIGGMERERDIPLVLQLSNEHQHRASTGGWGLGAGMEERQREEDDDDETMDWDQAQAVVERMVGMKPLESPSETRRRVA